MVGLVGTFSVVVPVFHALDGCIMITLVFMICPFAGALIASFNIYRSTPRDSGTFSDRFWHAFSIFLAIVVSLVIAAFGLLYMDWILGAIAGNFAGVPSKGNALLYWTYFAVKRLGLLAV